MVEKVPCKTCGAMILPTTAEKNGGLCMPCKQGNRENIENSKEYYKKQKEYDPFRELWHSLVKRVHATDDEEAGFNALTDDEKIYFAVGILDGEVYNGGMHQFFSNSSGSLFQEVIKGLELLNATNSLWLVRKATKILFGDINPPKNRFQRWEAMKQYPEDDNAPTPEWSVELEKINEQYWEDPDGINDLLVNFAETKGLVEHFKKPNKASQPTPKSGAAEL